MAPKTLAGVLFIAAIVYPAMISCESRGEAFRGPSTGSVRGGYLIGRSQQYQSQSQPYPEFYQQQSQSFSNSALNYNSPPYPDYQSQPALYSQTPFIQQPAYQPVVNPSPSYSEYYDPPPTPLYPKSPPNYSQTYHPIAQSINSRPPPQTYKPNQPNPELYKPPSSRPQASPEYYNKVQTQQNSNLDNRFGPDDASTQDPNSGPVDQFSTRPTKKGTRRPYVTRLPPRFDSRDDVRKSLIFDGDLSKAIEVFSLNLLFDLNSQKEDENFMISPFSIYHLLVLLAEGAGGETYQQIDSKLNLLTLQRTRDFQQYLNVVLKRNSAEVVLRKFAMMVTDKARPINPDYETRIETVYDADVMPVNFLDVDNTVRSINGAVSNYTDGQITEAVKRDDLFKAQLILISGLFFQGKWMNVFNSSFTKAEPFYDTNGVKTGDVNMMFQRGPFAYAGVSDLGCHILELPYAEAPVSNRNDLMGTGLSMILVLPRKGLSLNQAINNIYSLGMARLYAELHKSKVEYEDDEVEVHLPRFEITSSMDMKEILEGMGINNLFDQTTANLENINKNYFVSSMIHKTKISVDEYGTTAAAVTTSIFANKATPPKFHANKPFAFFIVDRVTNLILFSGQYVTPTLY